MAASSAGAAQPGWHGIAYLWRCAMASKKYRKTIMAKKAAALEKYQCSNGGIWRKMTSAVANEISWHLAAASKMS